jgi:hypothetical protein
MSTGYDPSKPGLDEARLEAYRRLLISRLDLLNTALMRDRRTPVGEVTPEMVEIGDSETLWDIGMGGIRIRIRGGDETSPLDFESALTLGVNGCSGFRYTFYTHLAIYIHPDALAAVSVRRQAEARERLLSRLNDWVTLGVCNYWNPETATGGLTVQLGTSILSVPPQTDALLESHVYRGYRDTPFRGFGGAELIPALHLIVQASIE